MAKVQKTYTAELKREAVGLAQTSGKPIAQARWRVGHERYLYSPVAQGAGDKGQRSLSGK